MTYTTSFDSIVKKKTAAVFIIFTICTIIPLPQSDKWIWSFSFFIFFMLLLLYSYLRRPTEYRIEKGVIEICRPIGKITIDICELEKVDRINHDILTSSTKGGAFGYNGKFDTEFGKLTWHATRRDNLVLLTMQENSKIILTPDQRDNFVNDIQNEIARCNKSI
jgi:hypothetical protein